MLLHYLVVPVACSVRQWICRCLKDQEMQIEKNTSSLLLNGTKEQFPVNTLLQIVPFYLR